MESSGWRYRALRCLWSLSSRVGCLTVLECSPDKRECRVLTNIYCENRIINHDTMPIQKIEYFTIRWQMKELGWVRVQRIQWETDDLVNMALGWRNFYPSIFGAYVAAEDLSSCFVWVKCSNSSYSTSVLNNPNWLSIRNIKHTTAYYGSIR